MGYDYSKGTVTEILKLAEKYKLRISLSGIPALRIVFHEML